MTATETWPLFLRAHAALTDAIGARLSAAGLPSLLWYDALWALERAPGRRLRMGELADTMVLSRSHLTHLVGQLEKARLVRRSRSPDDRRGTYAALTDKGAALRARMWPVYRASIDELFARRLRPAQAGAMAAGFRRLLAGLR
ncbi:MAG: MarR family transcriptional regulator [Alphaproteobacteria bacterium]|nr:MarR family transcriptional regulator [Alphaproteobacteria bacterium]MCW5738648.1 MarR family transcriptional regulator [Alphaproteobacteria bacterium]